MVFKSKLDWLFPDDDDTPGVGSNFEKSVGDRATRNAQDLG